MSEHLPTSQQIEDQTDALETYRPNFIAGYQEDIDTVKEKIQDSKSEIKRSSTPYQRIGKNFMTAMSYVPGLDIVIGTIEERARAEQVHIDSNYDRWLKDPSTKLEKANMVYAMRQGGTGKYAEKYDKLKAVNKKHQNNKDNYKRYQTIAELQQEIKEIHTRIKSLHNGEPL